jgi:hypothetical protein
MMEKYDYFMYYACMSEKVTIFVDESYSDSYVSVAAIAVQGDENRQTILAALKKLSLKPEFITATKGNLHYQEEGVGARQVMAVLLRQIPASAYLALSVENVPTDKVKQDELVYGVFLPRLLNAVLQKYSKHGADYSVEVIFENLSDELTRDKKYFESQLVSLRNSFDFEVVVGTKANEPLLCLPDYFLGFARDVVLQDVRATWPTQLFELIADKIGVILAFGEQIERYNRGDGVRRFLASHRGK